MSFFTKLGNDIAAPTDGLGAQRSVSNADMQRWMTEVERATLAFQAGGGIIFPDLATANASLAYAQNQMAWVIGDPVPANNGVYRKIGASGTGSWARMGDLPFSMIPFSNAGAGTVDAIVATPMLPPPTTPGAALLTVNILAANTGNVTLNGKPLRTNSGNEIVPDGLVAGGIYLAMDLGNEYRLVSDQASAAIVAAAEAARTAAEAAAQAAEDAAAGVNLPPIGAGDSGKVLVVNQAEDGYELIEERAVVRVANRTELKALDGTETPVAYLYGEGGRNGTFVWQAGNHSSFVTSDPGEGIYIATSSDPTGASGAWVRQHDEEILAIWFGVVADDSTDNTTTLQRAINFCSTHLWARFLRLPPGVCRTSTLTIQQHITVEGTGFLRTVLRFTNITGDCIKLDHGSTTLTGLALRNFRVDAVTQKTDGWALIQTCNDGAAIYFLELENLLFTDNLFHGWSLQSCFFSEINRVNISKIGVAAIGIRLKGASLTRRVVEITLNNCGVNNGSGGASIGLLIDSYTEGVWLNRVALEKRDIGYAMRIDNSLYPADSDAADSVKNIFGSQVCCDRSGFSCLRIDGGRTIHFSNSWFSSALNNHGIDLVSGFDISFSDCDISNNAQNGVRIRPGATDVVFNGCGIHANSVGEGNTGVYSGIDADPNAKNFTINACRFHRLPGSAKRQKHAVRIQGGSSEGYIITNNRDGGSLDPVSYLDAAMAAYSVIANNLD